MKSASLPSLRVEPELRRSAELVLREGETLSAFIESSLRANIERRLARNEFIARGLASREHARATGEYIAADEVLSVLHNSLFEAKQKKR
ncbi:MAG: YlcI/YnfO family protein [Chlorobiaceae bacterium]